MDETPERIEDWQLLKGEAETIYWKEEVHEFEAVCGTQDAPNNFDVTIHKFKQLVDDEARPLHAWRNDNVWFVKNINCAAYSLKNLASLLGGELAIGNIIVNYYSNPEKQIALRIFKQQLSEARRTNKQEQPPEG